MSAETFQFDAPRRAERPFRIAICGLGVVGGALARLLAERGERIGRRVGRALSLSAVSARRRRRAGALKSVRWLDDPLAAADDASVDAVVELIGGCGVARELATRVLRAGKPLITANKQLLAEHGDELLELARRHAGALACEGAVGGGVPMVKSLREALIAHDVSWLWGILNGTGNYVLTRMAASRGAESFEQALAGARKRGYAEADSADDIDGHDAARKLAVLARLAWGLSLDVRSVRRHSLRAVTALDARLAAAFGCAIKPLALAWRATDGMQLHATPALLASSAAAAAADGVDNYLAVGDADGDVTACSGPGAGGPQTARAVLADIADLAAGRVPAWPRGFEPAPGAPLISGHYWRIGPAGPKTVDSARGVLRDAGLRLGEPAPPDAQPGRAGPSAARVAIALLSAAWEPERVERAESGLRRLVGDDPALWLRLPLVRCEAAGASARSPDGAVG